VLRWIERGNISGAERLWFVARGTRVHERIVKQNQSATLLMCMLGDGRKMSARTERVFGAICLFLFRHELVGDELENIRTVQQTSLVDRVCAALLSQN
jgi:hypothetical protein